MLHCYILDSVLKGIGVVAQGPISPASWAYDSSFAPYTYNINTAKAELTQAGASGVSFTMLIPSGSPLQTQEAQFIQSELQPAGITVNIQQETFATLLSDTDSHNFQAALLGWSHCYQIFRGRKTVAAAPARQASPQVPKLTAQAASCDVPPN